MIITSEAVSPILLVMTKWRVYVNRFIGVAQKKTPDLHADQESFFIHLPKDNS
jgi:hypothetical protein